MFLFYIETNLIKKKKFMFAKRFPKNEIDKTLLSSYLFNMYHLNVIETFKVLADHK